MQTYFFLNVYETILFSSGRPDVNWIFQQDVEDRLVLVHQKLLSMMLIIFSFPLLSTTRVGRFKPLFPRLPGPKLIRSRDFESAFFCLRRFFCCDQIVKKPRPKPGRCRALLITRLTYSQVFPKLTRTFSKSLKSMFPESSKSSRHMPRMSNRSVISNESITPSPFTSPPSELRSGPVTGTN